MKKLNKYKIFFLISLLPYFFIFSYAVYSAINGITYTFIQSHIIYGFDGFLHGLITGLFGLIVFPILPICLTYQILYFVFRKKENKKLMIIATITTTSLLLLLVGGWSVNKLNQTMEKNRFETKLKNKLSVLVKNADEIIDDYTGNPPDTVEDDNSEFGGFMGTRFKRSAILIDYDSKKVTFIFPSPNTAVRDESCYYKEYRLSEGTEIYNSNVQYRKELGDPGKTFTTFFLENNKSRTIAMELCMADGSVYNINEMKDPGGRLGIILNFPWSIFD